MNEYLLDAKLTAKLQEIASYMDSRLNRLIREFTVRDASNLQPKSQLCKVSNNSTAPYESTPIQFDGTTYNDIDLPNIFVELPAVPDLNDQIIAVPCGVSNGNELQYIGINLTKIGTGGGGGGTTITTKNLNNTNQNVNTSTIIADQSTGIEFNAPAGNNNTLRNRDADLNQTGVVNKSDQTLGLGNKRVAGTLNAGDGIFSRFPVLGYHALTFPSYQNNFGTSIHYSGIGKNYDGTVSRYVYGSIFSQTDFAVSVFSNDAIDVSGITGVLHYTNNGVNTDFASVMTLHRGKAAQFNRNYVSAGMPKELADNITPGGSQTLLYLRDGYFGVWRHESSTTVFYPGLDKEYLSACKKYKVVGGIVTSEHSLDVATELLTDDKFIICRSGVPYLIDQSIVLAAASGGGGGGNQGKAPP